MNERAAAAGGGPGLRKEAEVVEVSLLLTAGEFRRLAAAASRRGLTVGELIRRAARDHLRGPTAGGEKNVYEVA
ncbi:MAG: hypothetical protein U0797_03435 [Gemmataceae bacterium]